MKRTLTLITDPGHGWLSVSLADLNALGIANKITSCSSITSTRAYLEEDCDAVIFLDAAKLAGWDITIKEGNGNANSYAACRNFAGYMAYFAKNPFGEGSEFSYRGTNGKREGKYLFMENGIRFTFRKSNPLLGLDPPITRADEIPALKAA